VGEDGCRSCSSGAATRSSSCISTLDAAVAVADAVADFVAGSDSTTTIWLLPSFMRTVTR
jgi:hypothetical protein